MTEQPFKDIRVVEFGQFVAVPVASQLLAEGGAHVIKVEALTGDPIRLINPLSPGESRYFISRNCGKHSLPLALSDAAAIPVVKALVASADVVLMNLRPGLAAKLGLEPQHLAERHPRLIIGSVSAFGNEGPEALEAGMDLVVQARSGLMAANGRISDGRPAAGDPVSADCMCAMTLAFGVSAALLRRERTGNGGIVDTSLMQAAMTLANNQLVRSEEKDAPEHAALLRRLKVAQTEGASFADQLELLRNARRAHMLLIYYRTYATRDSFIAVACGSHALRVKFAAALGITDAGLEPGFDGDLDAHYEALGRQVENLLAGSPSEHWLHVLRSAGVPVSAVRFPIELFDDPQVNINNMLTTVEHPQAGAITMVAPPVSLDGDGFRPGAPTAAFGSESDAILLELGFSPSEVEDLMSANISHRGLA